MHRSQSYGTPCRARSCSEDGGRSIGARRHRGRTGTCPRTDSSRSHCTSDRAQSCSERHWSPGEPILSSGHSAYGWKIHLTCRWRTKMTRDDASWQLPSPWDTASGGQLPGSAKTHQTARYRLYVNQSSTRNPSQSHKASPAIWDCTWHGWMHTKKPLNFPKDGGSSAQNFAPSNKTFTQGYFSSAQNLGGFVSPFPPQKPTAVSHTASNLSNASNWYRPRVPHKHEQLANYTHMTHQ